MAAYDDFVVALFIKLLFSHRRKVRLKNVVASHWLAKLHASTH